LTLIKGARFHQFLVLAAAGEKEQGDSHEVLGDGVNAGIDPDVVLVRVGQPPRSCAMSRWGGKGRRGGPSRERWAGPARRRQEPGAFLQGCLNEMHY